MCYFTDLNYTKISFAATLKTSNLQPSDLQLTSAVLPLVRVRLMGAPNLVLQPRSCSFYNLKDVFKTRNLHSLSHSETSCKLQSSRRISRSLCSISQGYLKQHPQISELWPVAAVVNLWLLCT